MQRHVQVWNSNLESFWLWNSEQKYFEVQVLSLQKRRKLRFEVQVWSVLCVQEFNFMSCLSEIDYLTVNRCIRRFHEIDSQMFEYEGTSKVCGHQTGFIRLDCDLQFVSFLTRSKLHIRRIPKRKHFITHQRPPRHRTHLNLTKFQLPAIYTLSFTITVYDS